MATYTDPTIIQLNDKPHRMLGAYLFIGAGVVSLLCAGAFFFVSNQVDTHTAELNSQISQQQSELASLKPTADTLTKLATSSKNLHILFDNQKSWDAVLGTIEQRLYKNMNISSLQLSESGEMALNGSTSSYDDYAKIYKSLTDEQGQMYFSLVRPGNTSKVVDKAKNTTVIQFGFTLTLQKDVLALRSVKSLAELTDLQKAPTP